jgi:hypothetical protein
VLVLSLWVVRRKVDLGFFFFCSGFGRDCGVMRGLKTR